MKKIFISTSVICLLAFGEIFSQSVVLTPDKMDQRGGSNDNILLRNGSDGSPNLTAIKHGGTFAAPTSTQGGHQLFGIFGQGYGTALTGTRAGIQLSADETWTGSANGTRITFNTTANGTTGNTERMRIDNTGNVGIGTSAPSKKLHVSDGSSGVTPNGFAAAFFENSSSSYIQLASPETSAVGVLFGKPSSNISGSILYDSGNNISLRTGGNASRVTITSTGDVGIGTSGPDTKLHVSGSVESNGTDATFKVTNSSSSMLFDGNEIDVASNGAMYLNYNTTGNIYLANGGGRVAIGNNGTLLNEVIKATVNIPSFNVAANGCVSQTVTVANAAVDSAVSCTPDIGLSQGLVVAYSRVSSLGNVLIRICNYTAALITQNTSDYHIGIVR